MPARVRDFLYVDPALVAQTLSQLDFGVFRDWQETLERTRGTEGGLALSLWGSANIGGKGQKSEKTASEVAFEQTAESYAARLLFRLEEEEQLVEVGADAVVDLRRGTILAAAGEIDQLGIGPSERHEELVEGDAATASAIYAVAEKPDVAAVIEARPYKVVAPLIAANLRVGADELTGDAELVGIVRRVFRHDASDPARILAIVQPIVIY